jgi:hypothetical protein
MARNPKRAKWYNNINIMDEVQIEDVINKLKELGYFKFVAETDLPKAIEITREHLKEKSLSDDSKRYETDDKLVSFDFRKHHMDSEDLAEGGLKNALENLNYTLEKIGLSLPSLSESENEAIYNNPDHEHLSTITLYKLLELTNNYLASTQSPERLYTWGDSWNDTEVIFLTEEIYNYLITVPGMKKWLPIDYKEPLTW